MAMIALKEGDFLLLPPEDQYKLNKEVFLTIHFDSDWMNLNTEYDAVLAAFHEEMLQTPMGELRGAQDIITSDKELAEEKINSIIASNTSEENEKIVLQIYLNYLDNNEVLTADQYSTLANIASQNPLVNGIAVYWARSLTDLNFDDLYSEPDLRLSSFEDDNNNEFDYKVYPNPARDKIIFAGNNLDGATLNIYNSLGQVVITKKLSSGINIVNTFEPENMTGFYVYEIISGQRSVRGKITINK